MDAVTWLMSAVMTLIPFGIGLLFWPVAPGRDAWLKALGLWALPQLVTCLVCFFASLGGVRHGEPAGFDFFIGFVLFPLSAVGFLGSWICLIRGFMKIRR